MISPNGNRRLRFRAFVVSGIIALNVLEFAMERGAHDTDAYIEALAMIPFNITHHITLGPPGPAFAPLTLVTSIFVHGSVAHIFFNMLFLFAFGPQVESVCGHARFAAFYLLCGIAGGVAMIAMDPGSHVPEIGASGAIAGILGAYIVNFPRATIATIAPLGRLPFVSDVPVVVVIVAWMLVQFDRGFGTLAQHVTNEPAGTAYFAHIGGFCAGVLAIEIFRLRSRAVRGYRSDS